MKGILFSDFLIQKDFFNTRSRQWSFQLTNQKRTSDNARTNENFALQKSNQNWNRQRASERRVNESDVSFEFF